MLKMSIFEKHTKPDGLRVETPKPLYFTPVVFSCFTKHNMFQNWR